MSGANGQGIPQTDKDAYDPTQTVPDTAGFVDYLTRGYSTIQNLAANVILKQESGEDDAIISLLAAPMPAVSDKVDPFKDILTGVLPFLILLIFIPPVYNMVF